jgi:hypothetical protein
MKPYELGDMYSKDFDIKGMLETVGKVETLSDTEIINLSESLRDMNFHTLNIKLAFYLSGRANKLPKEELNKYFVLLKEVLDNELKDYTDV